MYSYSRENYLSQVYDQSLEQRDFILQTEPLKEEKRNINMSIANKENLISSKKQFLDYDVYGNALWLICTN